MGNVSLEWSGGNELNWNEIPFPARFFYERNIVFEMYAGFHNI